MFCKCFVNALNENRVVRKLSKLPKRKGCRNFCDFLYGLSQTVMKKNKTNEKIEKIEKIEKNLRSRFPAVKFSIFLTQPVFLDAKFYVETF